MKKFFAFAVLICVMSDVSSAEEIKAWDLNERIHPQLKESFMKMPEMNITNENIKELQKAFIPSAESLQKDDKEPLFFSACDKIAKILNIKEVDRFANKSL